MTSLNIPAMRQWVVALRSGEFEQGTGSLAYTPQPHLHRSREYCCLGVAAMIFAEECKITVSHDDGYNGGFTRFYWSDNGVEKGAADLLPMPVVDLLGIPTDMRDEDVNNGQQADIILPINVQVEVGMASKVTTSSLNDTHGWTFAQIADALEFAFPMIKVTNSDV